MDILDINNRTKVIDSKQSAIKSFVVNWKEYLREHPSRIIILVALFFTVFILVVSGDFFSYIQNRPGSIINDPLISYIPSGDVSWIIFPLLYISVLISAFYTLPDPESFVIGYLTLCFICLTRFLSILLFPLEPPMDLIQLKDPLLDFFFYTTEAAVTKDLFYSGHTAVIFTCFLVVKNKQVKWLMAIGTIGIGVLVLVQRVHYTADVLFAIPVTWLIYNSTGIVYKRFKKYYEER